jgi:hypothetical protein
MSFLFLESKQDIISLGYPSIIATIMYQQFGKNAVILAKWYKNYKSYKGEDKDWWKLNHWSLRRDHPTLSDLTYLYDATKDSNSYKKALEFLDWSDDEEFYDDYYLQDQRESIKTEIEETFLNETFFKWFSLPKAVIDGKITDIAPYKDLPFLEAQTKFDKKQIFQEKTPLKIYSNGYKWIDVGKKCYLVGQLMKNCGSTGVMSLDNDRTMIVLFDKQNKPHAVVTYSPNEKRISGDQGKASTEVKSKYHDYIIDLTKILNVKFDTERTKSDFLKVKYLLRDKIVDIYKLKSGIWDKLFTFTTRDGKRFYTNSSDVLPESDVLKLKNYPFKNRTGSLVGNVFNHVNRQNFPPQLGLNFIRLQDF